MNLVEIKHYLMQVKMTSLASISAYFKCDAELMRQMMSHWLRKGCVRKLSKTPACGGSCMKCAPSLVEIYEWVN
ncbi:MAG: hypothetical protein ACD_60C00157G0009 [uncultured bacterium]|nr:MAG: hypothetical protein ACD_60C00157G0009 [uncultured bacterium]